MSQECVRTVQPKRSSPLALGASVNPPVGALERNEVDNKEIGREPRKQMCARSSRFVVGGLVVVEP